MNRTRDWRRAQTASVRQRRKRAAESYRYVGGGTLNSSHPRWLETPNRCECLGCIWRRQFMATRQNMTHADLWRRAADEGADWPPMGNPRAREEIDDELGMDDYCGAADIADRGCAVGSGVRLRGADREGRR